MIELTNIRFGLHGDRVFGTDLRKASLTFDFLNPLLRTDIRLRIDMLVEGTSGSTIDQLQEQARAVAAEVLQLTGSACAQGSIQLLIDGLPKPDHSRSALPPADP